MKIYFLVQSCGSCSYDPYAKFVSKKRTYFCVLPIEMLVQHFIYLYYIFTALQYANINRKNVEHK